MKQLQSNRKSSVQRNERQTLSVYTISFLSIFFLASFLFLFWLSEEEVELGFHLVSVPLEWDFYCLISRRLHSASYDERTLSFLLILFDTNFFPFSFFKNDYKTSLVGIEDILYLNRPISLVHYLSPVLIRKWKYGEKVSLYCSLHFESPGECLFTLSLFFLFETNSKYLTS